MSLVAAAMDGAEFNVEKLAERAGQNWITITELADTLARDHGLPFKAAHSIAAKLIATTPRDAGCLAGHDAARRVEGGVRAGDRLQRNAQLREILSPRHFVEVRKTHGGPAPSETGRASKVSNAVLLEDRKWLADTRARLQAADDQLRKAANQL